MKSIDCVCALRLVGGVKKRGYSEHDVDYVAVVDDRCLDKGKLEGKISRDEYIDDIVEVLRDPLKKAVETIRFGADDNMAVIHKIKGLDVELFFQSIDRCPKK